MEVDWKSDALTRPSSPDSRRDAIELLKELRVKLTEEMLVPMPKLLSFLKHDDPVVVRQTIATGLSLFCDVLQEMALQLQKFGKVDGWLDEMWSWMVQFKDTVSRFVSEHGSVGTKVLVVKFLEVCFKHLTSDTGDSVLPSLEGEGDKTICFLLDVLQSGSTHCGFVTIAVINSVAAIARSRPLYFDRVLSSLLGMESRFVTLKGGHAPSLQKAVKTAVLGFLRCTHPSILESKEKMLRFLRTTYPSEATEQIIRQVEKMSKSMERVSRDVRVSKDDLPTGHTSMSEDPIRKRPIAELSDVPISRDMPAKRTHYITSVVSSQPFQPASDIQDDVAISSNTSTNDGGSTPAEQMITMIGALVAEGDRGAKSLEILISSIHADLLADIVMETMKHLPKDPLEPSSRPGNESSDSHAMSATVSSEIGSPDSATVSVQASALSSQITSVTGDSNRISLSTSDMPSLHNLLADSKRDPRRDRHRLDPRRAAEPVGQHSLPSSLEDNKEMPSVPSSSLSKPAPASDSIVQVENDSVLLTPKKELMLSGGSLEISTDQLTSKESSEEMDDVTEDKPSVGVPQASDSAVSLGQNADEEVAAPDQLDISEDEGVGDMLESDHSSSSFSTASLSDDTCHDSPALPLYVDLTDDQKKMLCKLTVKRIIEGYQKARASSHGQARLRLLARLVAQVDADDDVIALLQQHIILYYHQQEGHDLAMHVLYHLRTVMISEPDEYSTFAANNYEKFLLAVSKALLDSMPASDKSFSRLLGEAPFLTDSALRLLEDLCHSRYYEIPGKDTSDGDRVTQGLGAIWSLILCRPLNRQACLNIVLKCTVHSSDEVRSKAIRLVANKLYLLKYASDDIEQFATTMLLSVVDQEDIDLKTASSQLETTAGQEVLVCNSQKSEPGGSETESTKGIQESSQSDPTISFSHAQRQTSLFFALCMKRPSLLKVIFDNYGRAPKSVKQSVHRHVPILVRTLGSSHSELLRIISDPPEGSENLIMLALRIMTEESTPSDKLITVVKHLYETKLKDVAILIPMLSSLSKDEVLPIFPRLVDLPLDKFQSALARMLQGSAHTGPALTPVEALVAVHDINPERDGVALKKITDACTACFEQRTVFTQHVLEKSLSHLVDKVPLPLLLMRTVIQAIDAFPAMVDSVMGLLSKLVVKQIWRMPKLWVGFLKCASQTQPHSFNVLLQLPPPHLESALSRYTNLRGPLATFVSQSNMTSSLSRHTLRVLGLVNDPQPSARSYPPATLQASDRSSSVHGSTLT